ncbi:MAG TPA: glycoside hydrolase family 9 protein [Verrucomicrobiae bacterium]
MSGGFASADVPVYPPLTNDMALRLPLVGENALHILSSNMLELKLVTTKALTQGVSQWDFANNLAQANNLPAPHEFVVLADGNPVSISAIAFKRRPFYAPLASYDLRIDNDLYLQLAKPIAAGQTVRVLNPDASLWPPTMQFRATASPFRFNPAIHVNQVGYVPTMPKKAMVGYYLGSLGEMTVTTTNFQIVDAKTRAVVFSGQLKPRPDIGYNYAPLPYQNVLEADFSSFTNAGEYKLVVPGLGASYPFFIDDGIAAAFARAYELGLYEQRCGTSNSLPFTRFVHDACHTAPASVPSPQLLFTNAWRIIASYGAAINSNNPLQIAPPLINEAAQLYPFMNTGTVDVSGGHHDAGDYSKYTWDSAQLIHVLLFAADSLPGVGALDNLGIPESGDGKSDILQEAKWEADFLAKMQDADGGFYYLVYPRNREYENNVLPENGDPQIVWPKNTVATAAAVAALAQCSSSPLFKAQFPQAASNYLAKAVFGWQFLTNAINRFGLAGSYQKLIHYGDEFTHNDELAWAACELYLATGDPQYQQALFQMLPDPTNPNTFRWSWWRMYACYGNAIRSYAFAARSGRLSASQLDSNYLAKCETEIIAAAQDQLNWSQQSAYGTSFPTQTKQVRSGGWYFSVDQAFDLAVASALDDYPPLNDPHPKFLEAMLENMNYEGGCNPVNVSYVEGLGWKRQRDIVNQYALNDRRVLPPSGIPVGNIVAGFDYLSPYQSELGALCFASDGAAFAPYPPYDRWGDSWNVQTEPTIVNQARQLATAAFLMAKTSLATQTWQSASAQIVMPANVGISNSVSAAVNAPNFDLTKARVVWEAQNQEPTFGTNFVFTPTNYGMQWIEVEAQWPDGRRIFATTNFFSTNSPPTVKVRATDLVAVIGRANPARFTFTRTGKTSAPLTVNFTLGGTAPAGDYRTTTNSIPSSITIPAGASSYVMAIVGVTNSTGSNYETATVTLQPDTAYNVGPPGSATVTIINLVSRIFNFKQATRSGVTVEWISVPGFNYRVASKDQLTDPDWANLSGNIVAISTNTAWTDASAASVPQRFYVVQADTTNGIQTGLLASNLVLGVVSLTVNWTCLPGQIYHVMFKNNLTDPDWTDLSGPLTAGETAECWTDFVNATIPQRFYRILQEP